MRISHFIILSLAPLAFTNSLPKAGREVIVEHHAIHEIRQAIPPVGGLPEPIDSIIKSVLALLSSLLQTLTTGLDAGSVPSGLLGNFTDAIAALKGPLPDVPALPVSVSDTPLSEDLSELPTGDLPIPPIEDIPLPDLQSPDLPATSNLPITDLPIQDTQVPELPTPELPVPKPDLPLPALSALPKLPIKSEGTQVQDAIPAKESTQEQDPSPTQVTAVDTPVPTDNSEVVEGPNSIATEASDVLGPTAPAVSDPSQSAEIQQVTTSGDTRQPAATESVEQIPVMTGLETSFFEPTETLQTIDFQAEATIMSHATVVPASNVNLPATAAMNIEVLPTASNFTAPATRKPRRRRNL